MTLLDLALTRAVKARALELGFDAVAIGPATPEHAPAFERWLDAGFGASMTYLERTRADRVDPELLLPGARSTITVALSYNPGEATNADDWTPVARYARGTDYHDVIRPRLKTLVSFLREAGGPRIESRATIDTSAVLERDLAARAGLGWFGKNTNLLSEKLGSYFFIGVVLTTATLSFDDPVPDRCGTCTACLDACPTKAFVGPYVLDARRCISYLTIELRGDVPPELRPAVTDWVFGCDVCQEVCPWNRKAAPGREPAFTPRQSLGALPSLLTLDDAAFRARFRGTAITRARRAGLLRNVALTLGNRPEARPAARAALGAALDDPDPVVRRAATWSLGRIAERDPEAESTSIVDDEG